MATFVLVHGAFAGGWVWNDVARALEEAGHRVAAPTLTGLGERVHLARPETNLDTHIQDVLNVLRYEELSDVILAGHSYGGMVITGVGDRVPERLRHLVFVDALIPRDGESGFDCLPPGVRASCEQQAQAANDYRIPVSLGLAPAEFAGIVRGRETPHPLATFQQPIVLSNTGRASIPSTFIACTGPDRGLFDRFAEHARRSPGWRVRELATIHDCMLAQPRELADLLLEAAAL